MKQEEKQLLFTDLSARLPYHVKVKVWLKDGTTEEGFLDLEHNYADVLTNAFYGGDIKDIKPFLRSMSSMTEEEKEELKTLFDAEEITSDSICYLEGGTLEEYLSHISYSFCSKIIDWLNRHHFDYRGLIRKGLAIEAPKEKNPYEK